MSLSKFIISLIIITFILASKLLTFCYGLLYLCSFLFLSLFMFYLVLVIWVNVDLIKYMEKCSFSLSECVCCFLLKNLTQFTIEGTWHWRLLGHLFSQCLHLITYSFFLVIVFKFNQLRILVVNLISTKVYLLFFKLQ